MPRPSDLLTLEEAAEIAGLSPVTLRVQIRNHRLEATKRAGVWFVTRRELARYMAKVQRSGSPSQEGPR